MDYYIRTFDVTTGIIGVEYSSGEYVSFPLPVNSAGFIPVNEELDSFIKSMQPVGPKRVSIQNPEAVTTLIAPFAEAAETIDGLRVKRNKMLSDCDWTQLPGAPLTEEQKQEWADYRQQLRDMTSTPNLNLSNIVWPKIPNSYVIPDYVGSFSYT